MKNENNEPITIFYDTNGERLGSASGLLHIPLYKGMKMTIHGFEVGYYVEDWNYHHGHGDEDAGLRIILRPED